MNVHVLVEAERQAQVLNVAGLARSRVRQERLARATERDFRVFARTDRHAAGHRARVVVYAVVGNLQVVRVAVHEDATAALRTVADAQAVDARRIAIEVGRIDCGLGATHDSAIGSRQQRRVDRERSAGSARGRAEGIEYRRVAREFHTLAKHRDHSTFVGTQQAGFDHLLGQVAVQGRIPAQGRFEGQPVDGHRGKVTPPARTPIARASSADAGIRTAGGR